VAAAGRALGNYRGYLQKILIAIQSGRYFHF